MLAANAWGCTCAGSPTGTPPCQYAWAYTAIFTGTVTGMMDPGPLRVPAGAPAAAPLFFPQRKVRIDITEALTGLDRNQKEIEIETGLGGGDCGYGFQRGLEYIVYASKRPGGGFSTGICSPTRPLEKAAEDLKYFHQLERAPPVAEIRVTALGIHRNPGNQMPVLAGARVTIDGPGVHQTTTTDAAGRHIFTGLPPGEYNVDVALEGYAIPYPILPVRVRPKGCAEVALLLQLDRVVSGRILTRDGLPCLGRDGGGRARSPAA